MVSIRAYDEFCLVKLLLTFENRLTPNKQYFQEISWISLYLKFLEMVTLNSNFLPPKSWLCLQKYMFELFLGLKHPIYRVKPKKQLFRQRRHLHGHLDSHYQIIKRIKPTNIITWFKFNWFSKFHQCQNLKNSQIKKAKPRIRSLKRLKKASINSFCLNFEGFFTKNAKFFHCVSTKDK